jgi:hypothetical protein
MNYSCTPLAPGMMPSCHPDMNGIYATLAECEQDPKCPGPMAGPTSGPSHGMKKWNCVIENDSMSCTKTH